MSKATVRDFLDSLETRPHVEGEFGTEIQLEIDGVASRLQTQLIGIDTDRILIVKTPTMSQIGGINVKLFAGNRVIAGGNSFASGPVSEAGRERVASVFSGEK